MSLDPQREAEIRSRVDRTGYSVWKDDVIDLLDAYDALRAEHERLTSRYSALAADWDACPALDLEERIERLVGAVRGALQELWDGQTFTAAAVLRDALPPEDRP